MAVRDITLHCASKHCSFVVTGLSDTHKYNIISSVYQFSLSQKSHIFLLAAITDILTLLTQRLYTRVVRFGPERCQIWATSGTNPGLFHIRFTYIWSWLEIDLKMHGFVPPIFGAYQAYFVTNLTYLLHTGAFKYVKFAKMSQNIHKH